MGYDHDRMHFERKALIERDRERRRMEDLRITIDNRIARERATFEKLLHEVRSTPTDEEARKRLHTMCFAMLCFVENELFRSG